MKHRWRVVLAASLTVIGLCAAARAADRPARRARPTASMPTAAPTTGAPEPTVATGVPQGAVGPTVVVAGVPVGYRHDQAGALSAALHFLMCSETVIAMTEPAAVAAQREMATAAAGDGLAGDLRSQLAALHDGFGPGPVGYRVAPLAVRVAAGDANHIDIDVWYVAVIEPPSGSAYEDWRVMHYQLVWEHGDWHEAAEHDDAGPRPAVLTAAQPTAPGDWSAELAG